MSRSIIIGICMFIVIEGGDAAGKTTLINGLKESISNGLGILSSQNTIFLKSPTAPFDMCWKELIKTTTPLTRFYLFRSIAQNDIEIVRQALLHGKHVILERYLLSTEAFNWALDEKYGITDPALRSENHITYSGLIKPNIRLFLDVSDKTRELRLQRKDNRSDWENLTFQTMFNTKLRQLAQRDNWTFINTDKLNIADVLKVATTTLLQYQR